MSSAGPREKEKGRSTVQTRLLKPTKEKTLSSATASSSILHLVPQSVVSASLSGIERFYHASLLYRNFTKVVEKVLNNQPFYSLLMQTIYKIE